MKKEITEFLKESNAIEGVYDAVSLKQAKTAWEYLIKQKVLTHDVVLKTHKLLMLRQNLKPKHKGYYRDCEVRIAGRYGVHFWEIREQMDKWLGDVAVSVELPGIDGHHIQLDHIEYERIHPFVDGNGRTGRMFMNWQRLKAGLPILIIHAGDEQWAYYDWFKEG